VLLGVSSCVFLLGFLGEGRGFFVSVVFGLLWVFMFFFLFPCVLKGVSHF
jgi:hypothetical protein